MVDFISRWLSLVALLFSCGSSLQFNEQAPLTFFKHPETLDHIIIVPEHRLLFCAIPKVGSKTFSKLFAAARVPYDAGQIDCHWSQCNTPKAHGLDEMDLANILTNQSWHKAIFFRDPVERFLSAYLNKCENPVSVWEQRNCHWQFGDELPRSFADAVTRIANSPKEPRRFNVHFRPQVFSCGGLRETLKYYDTVEQLERATMRDKTIALLRKVGVDINAIDMLNELVPEHDDAEWKQYKNNTDAHDNLAKYIPPNDDQMARLLRVVYKRDVQLFNISS